MDDYKSGKYEDVPFDFPVELKPEDPVSWLKCQFEGRKKTFAIQDKAEFKDIVTKIYTHGYNADLILQDFIPGDDSNMRTLNAYVDKNHQVKNDVFRAPIIGRPNSTINW